MSIDIVNQLTSPPGEFEVQAQNKAFPTEGLSNSEAELLNNQLNQLLYSFESSVVRQLIMDRQDAIARTAALAKQSFDEKLMGGLNARDNEIGMSVLRPGHIYQDDTGTLQNDWYFQPGSTGWVDWIGDGTSANNYSVDEDQVTVVLGFIDQDVNTEISAINVDQFGRNADMLPLDLNDLRLRDNDTEQQLAAFPTMIAEENDEIHIRLRADRDVESQPRLVGFTFGVGSFLNSEDF